MSGAGASAPLHQQAERARTFGEDAARYARARPGYPPEIAEELGAAPGLRVLDVGCGTGKAGALFAARGCDVLGLEPDARMAAVARDAGLPVEVATFEEWEDGGRRFSLLIAGQAWHWIDPRRGAAKAATLLVPGGHLAPFWNFRRPLTGTLGATLEACYARLAPELLDGSVQRGASVAGERAIEPHIAAMDELGAFAHPEVRRYAWTTHYSAAAWRELLGTQSDHRLVEPERRRALFDAVEAAVAEVGTLEVTYDTVVIAARRVGP